MPLALGLVIVEDQPTEFLRTRGGINVISGAYCSKVHVHMYLDEGSEEAASADAKARGETTGATRSTQRGNRYNPITFCTCN
jgi:hypothetical protein